MAFYGFDLQPSWVWPASMRVSQWRPFGNWWIEIIALILGGFTKDLISDLENDQFLGPNFSKVAFNLHSCWLESSFPLFQVPELESPYYPKLSCIKSENELPQIARPELLHIYTLVEFLIKIHQFSRWICSQFGKTLFRSQLPTQDQSWSLVQYGIIGICTPNSSSGCLGFWWEWLGCVKTCKNTPIFSEDHENSWKFQSWENGASVVFQKKTLMVFGGCELRNPEVKMPDPIRVRRVMGRFNSLEQTENPQDI